MRAALGIATCILIAPAAPAALVAEETREEASMAKARLAIQQCVAENRALCHDPQVYLAIQPVGPEDAHFTLFSSIPDPNFIERRSRPRLSLPDLARDLPAPV